jgi:HlyD family secretion protein
VRKWILGGIALLVVAGVVVLSLLTGRPRGTPVEIGRVARGEIRSVVTATGEIEPRSRVDVSAQVIGRIETLHVREGDRVARGQRLVDLDRAQYLSQRDRAVATLAGSEAEVERAVAALEDARRKRDRARQLAAEKIASQEYLEAADLEFKSATAALSAAREGVREARAAVETAEDAVSKTSINSPIAGRVTKVNAEEGETVVTGTMNMPGSVILTVSDLSRIEAQVEVDEAAVARIRPGQRASVRVDAFPDKEFGGEVVEIRDPAVKKQDVAYFQVRIRLTGAPTGLRPGMTVRARIQADSRVGVLVVPIEAVVERRDAEKTARGKRTSNPDGEKIVYRIEEGKAKAAPVEIGLTDETRAEVVSGLSEGDRIAVGPDRTLKTIRDGSPVVEADRKK